MPESPIFTGATTADIAASLEVLIRKAPGVLEGVDRFESEEDVMAMVWIFTTGTDPFDLPLAVTVVPVDVPEHIATLAVKMEVKSAFGDAIEAALDRHGSAVRRAYGVVWDTDEGRSELASYGVHDRLPGTETFKGRGRWEFQRPQWRDRFGSPPS
jgi:hypothetical protein